MDTVDGPRGYFTLCEHIVVTDFDTGEDVCTKCGSVIVKPDEEIINAEESTEKPEPLRDGVIIPTARRNADYTLGGSLSGKISTRDIDAHGNTVKDKAAAKRMRKADRYYANTRHNADKSVRSAIWIIIMLCEKLCISETVKERAAALYRKAYVAGCVRGRSTRWISTACLYYASKEAKIQRPADDFVKALEESHTDKKGRKALFAAYKVLTKVLDLPLPGPVSPLSELTRFAVAAGLSGVSVSRATTLYEKIKAVEPTIFCGKNPAAIAVCLLYIASKYSKEGGAGQRLVSNAGKISVVTLRKRTQEYVIVLKRLGEYIPEVLLQIKPEISHHNGIMHRMKKRTADLISICRVGEWSLEYDNGLLRPVTETEGLMHLGVQAA
jgi:transcription initiation factor TFIIB